jgi:ubiquinone/menaquinone biosynthesis C-methylase UbiE
MMREASPDTRDKGLPDKFPPSEKSYSLYEGVRYQEHWEDRSHARQDALEQYIISGLLPASGRRIIDLGCGYGRLAPTYLDRFDQAVLYDGSLSLLRDARDTLGDRALLVAGDVGRLPFKAASFDCVLTIRVLQHVHDLAGTLEEMRRITAGNGTVVFSYHNKRNARRILRYFDTRKRGNPFSLESAEIDPTLISHHPRRIEAIMHAAGFSAPEYRGTVVVDSLASITERFEPRVPAGARWAPFMGRFWLAPWLIGRSYATADADPEPAGRTDDLFQCPSCQGDVVRQGPGFECPACHRTYPVEDGIYDFRL